MGDRGRIVHVRVSGADRRWTSLAPGDDFDAVALAAAERTGTHPATARQWREMTGRAETLH